jgi:ubiquitin C-terminal hydrolase
MGTKLTPEIFAIKLKVFEHIQGKSRPPCCIGESSTMMDLVFWLRALSGAFVAHFDPSKQIFQISTKFHTSMGSLVYQIFELSVAEDLGSFSLKMSRVDQKIAFVQLQNEFCRPGPVSTRFRGSGPQRQAIPKSWVLQFIPSIEFDDNNTDGDHPYNVFRRVIREKITPTDQREEMVQLRSVLFPNLGASLVALARKGRWRSEMGKVLSELTGGFVSVRYTQNNCRKFRSYGDSKWLFNLTCVLPWAIDILAKGPNCLMTDTTFKSVAPYTLPILHAIVANESIPIAFGISPTETSESYGNMYTHISQLMQSFSRCVTTQMIHNQVPLPAQRPANERWYENEPPSVINHDLSEQRHEKEVWTGEVETVDASPMARTGATVRQATDMLLKLPLLTDQGSALAKFVKTWNIRWILCHRHILESIGSGTLFAHWAARLLQCYDEAEWRRTVDVISKEMDRRSDEWTPQQKGYESLARLLGYTFEGDVHHLADRRRWALWERLGCPSTTNSAESVNGHLNGDISNDMEFEEKIEVVANHFLARYRSRNTWCDRSLRRNAGKCFPSGDVMALPWFSRSRLLFFRALHNLTTETKPVKRQFQPEILCFVIAASCVETVGPFPPPATWGFTTIGNGTDDKTSDRLVLTLDSCRTWRSYLCWQITMMIKKQLTDSAWENCGGLIFERVAAMGVELNIPEDSLPDPQSEAQWRCDCSIQWPEWLPNGRLRRLSTSVVPSSGPGSKKSCKSSEKPKSPSRPVNPASGFIGLCNPKNTCYVNATVQCLTHIQELHDYFAHDIDFSSRAFRTDSICSAYYQLQQAMDEVPKCGYLSPSGFLTVIGKANNWDMGAQRDVTDLLNFLLSSFHEELSIYNRMATARSGGVPAPVSSIIHDLFLVELRHWRSCSLCNRRSSERETVRVLELSVDQYSVDNVYDCLKSWNMPVPLPTHQCPRCGRKGGISFQPWLSKLPPFLILSINVSDAGIVKNISDSLDLANYFCESIDSSMKYELCAVIYHTGMDNKGHFIADIRMPDSWYSFDDAQVSKCEFSDCASRCVRVLIYKMVPV